MRAYFFVAIMFIITLHGNSVYALKENNYVEFVVEGKIIPLKKETKQRAVSTLESLLPTCVADSRTNVNIWRAYVGPREGRNRLLVENHIRIVYDKPTIIRRKGETFEISEMLLSFQDLEAQNLVHFIVEVYVWDKKNLRGFGECDESVMELLCNTEIEEHLFGEGFLQRCNQLREGQTVNGIQNRFR